MNEDMLEKIVLETIDIPSIPPVAAKVLQLVESEYTSINQLESIISQDQSFSTRLLKIANSPYYGRGRSIDSVATAIIIIGFNSMKSFVMAASMNDLHRKSGHFEHRHWEHSLGVSIASSLLAAQTKMLMPEEALVGGLIHDFGKILMNNSLPDQYSAVIEKVHEENIPTIVAENEIFGFNHCNLGGLVARKWKLPPNLEVVVEYHHAERYPPFEDSGYEVLCQIVQVADAMCLHLGIGMQAAVDFSKIGFEQLGLTAAHLEILLNRLEQDYASQKGQLFE